MGKFLDKLPYIGFLQCSAARLLSDFQLLQQHCGACSHIDITRKIFIPAQDVCCAEYTQFCLTKAHFSFPSKDVLSVALHTLREVNNTKPPPTISSILLLEKHSHLHAHQ